MNPSIEPKVPVINQDELIGRMMGSVQMAERMLTKFVAASETDCDELESLIRLGNVADIVSLAHRHKGTAQTMAAPRVASIAFEIEQRAASDPTFEMLELLRQLRDTHQEVRHQVEIGLSNSNPRSEKI